MQRVSQQYRSLLGKIAPKDSTVPFHSTVHGKLVPGSTLDASYWVENLVSRVEFVKGVQSVLDNDRNGEPIDTLIEVGPHPALQTPTKDIVRLHAPKRPMAFAHTLKRKVDGVEAVQQLVCSLFTQGMTLDFEAINFPNLSRTSRKPAVLKDLPKSEAPGKAILGWHEFKVFSWAEGRGWDQHCSGFVMVHEAKDVNPVDGDRRKAALESDLKQLASDICASCTVPVDSKVLYENISAGGVQYGPLFQGLSDISVGVKDKAMATLEVPDTKASMPYEHETDCIIHPATFDLCCQMMWVLQGFGQPGPKQTYVPSHVDEVSICLHHKIKKGDKMQLFGHHKLDESASATADNRIIATIPDNCAEVILSIGGMTLTPISNDIKGHKDTVPYPMCYKMHWEPCFEFLSADQYRELPRPLVDDGKGGERTHNLENMALHWLQEMLQTIPENEVSSFESHHQKFYRWAQETCRDAPRQNATPEAIEHMRNVNGASKLNCFVGERLPDILRGKVDALTLLLEDDMLGKYYEDLDGLRESYANASICIDKMAHQNPNCNILEIGAGTGGATLPILQSLGGNKAGSIPRFGHYTYTDISPGFFEKAKSKFEDWGRLMSYQTLDISLNPVDQGFKLGSFDMIVACNVLHATPQIGQTMANIRSLLKPGGKIMLIEETTSKAIHFPFALLPGWWLASEEIRQDGPLLTAEGWSNVMKENDFSGVDLCVEDYPGASYHSGCVIMGTANAPQSSLSLLSLESKLKDITGVSPVIAPDLEHVDITDKWCIFLGGMDKTILSHLTDEKFKAFQNLVRGARGLLWVVRHTKSDEKSLGSNMAIGLARTVRSETGLQFATLDLGERETVPDSEAVEHMINVFGGVFCHKSQLMQGDMEFVVRNGLVGVPRLLDNPELNLSVQLETPDAPPQLQSFKQKDRPLRLTAGPGLVLDELYFTDDASRNDPLPEDHIEIKVCCTGLNFRDVLMAMGQLRGNKLGQECAGVVSKVGAAVSDFSVGDRVTAMSPGCLSTYTRCHSSCAWVIPYDMPFHVAASIPAVFCTAYYSLVELGNLKRDESVLIHAAAGGVGQAAIIVSQSIGAHIFATVGSLEKKRFLMENYGLKDEQIFFSRDTSFAKGVRSATGGEGVDVALNSLSGDALQATFECVAPFGRFIELGKRDITQNSRLEMAHFNNNVSFASVDLGIVREKRPKLTRRLMREAFHIFVNAKAHSRWPITSLPISEVEKGFRALQSGQVIGKMVVEMTDTAQVKVHPARKEEKLLHGDGTYVVVGGTSGIGLDIASWMPSKGAKHIVLVSRSGASTEVAQKTIQGLLDEGINVQVCRCDVSSEQSVEDSLASLLSQMPPVRGVVYGAMVLRDTLFEKLTFEDYETVMKPRVHGIWNLQHALEKNNRSQPLDFFVTLSSAASFVGNLGQSPYAASGTFMAALAAYSQVSSIPCTTIDLPIVRGVGYLSDDSKRAQIESSLGTESVDATDIRGLVAAAIRNEMRETCDGHCVVGFNGVKTTPISEQPFWVNDTKLSHLLRVSTLAGEGTMADPVAASETTSPATAIRQCSDLDSAEAIIVTTLGQKISSILMRSAEDLDPSAPISAYGLDSLVAIEIRNWITRELEANLQILEILASDSMTALATHILKKSGIMTPELKTKWGLDAPEGRPAQG
ncbi:hypothetical protein N7468_002141 [Penicillium chermesinum]|uniref:Carrier domain-containing protein n=1 Tax=Penicillium chermesinum TaxID=63820 RepID=A0A9W9PHY5_9EURO|nr:uncharacterized protein N7468_002141 [Penicillium chermesinum]KAJ5247158.1 hypothetical protein N7468_002141 [Penicillium chermesinum]